MSCAFGLRCVFLPIKVSPVGNWKNLLWPHILRIMLFVVVESCYCIVVVVVVVVVVCIVAVSAMEVIYSCLKRSSIMCGSKSLFGSQP